MTTPCERVDDIKEIKDRLEHLRVMMQGNGKMGFITKAQLAYDYIVEKRKDKHDMTMVIYRIVMGIGLAFVAVKLGLK